ncbi:hypothetical protein GCM10027569_31110 [Flindersiella endophytica]
MARAGTPLAPLAGARSVYSIHSPLSKTIALFFAEPTHNRPIARGKSVRPLWGADLSVSVEVGLATDARQEHEIQPSRQIVTGYSQ